MGQPWGTLYNAKIIRNHELYFDENMEYKEDVHFNLYMAQFSQKKVIINQPLYFYNTVNPDSLTHSFTNKNMIVKVEKDVEGRIKYFRQFRPNDDLFKNGLDLHICRSFLTYIVPTCISQGNFIKCNKIYNKDIYKNAFKDADYKYCTKNEKIIISVIANHFLFLHYFYHKIIYLHKKYRLSKS